MKSLEQKLLAPTDRLLDEAAAELLPGADATSARLTILEAVAARTGGWSLDDYWATMQRDISALDADPGEWADKLAASIEGTSIPIALALSALSREVLPTSQQRKTGAPTTPTGAWPRCLQQTAFRTYEHPVLGSTPRAAQECSSPRLGV